MRRTALEKDGAILVPFEEPYVPTYVQWMQDEELREATASEPLSHEDVVRLQNEWRGSDRVCEWILLDRARSTGPGEPAPFARYPHPAVGDVTVFVRDAADDEDSPGRIGELSVMVADRASRRRGLARAALIASMVHTRRKLRLDAFEARIAYTNAPSLALFESIGFRRVSSSEAFREHTLRLSAAMASWPVLEVEDLF